MNTNLLSRLTLAFCGGFAGAFLALQFKHSWFAIALLFGLIGYLVADVKGFVIGLKRAVRESLENLQENNWDCHVAKQCAKAFFYGFGLVSLISIQTSVSLMILPFNSSEVYKEREMFLDAIMLTSLIATAVSIAFALLATLVEHDNQILHRGRPTIEQLREACTIIIPTTWIPRV